MPEACQVVTGHGPRQGVLLMAYGSPERPEALEEYYTDIRRGRAPSAEQVADLRRRYDAIGGLSPLAERTRSQVGRVREGLERRHPGRYVVELGLKHARPTIEEGVRALHSAGAEAVTLLVLAPHHSALSVGQYHDRARRAWAGSGRSRRCDGPQSWHDHPKLIALLAERTRAALGRLPAGCRPEVLVTAHSLPERAAVLDHPAYPEQLRQTGALLAAAAGLTSWRIAWQSAGRTRERWLGPDILDVIRRLPREGFDSVVVCPAGFTADHLEVLYDLDVEARGVAGEAGLLLERTASLNDDPAFVDLLCDLVVGHTAIGAR